MTRKHGIIIARTARIYSTCFNAINDAITNNVLLEYQIYPIFGGVYKFDITFDDNDVELAPIVTLFLLNNESQVKLYETVSATTGHDVARKQAEAQITSRESAAKEVQDSINAEELTNIRKWINVHPLNTRDDINELSYNDAIKYHNELTHRLHTLVLPYLHYTGQEATPELIKATGNLSLNALQTGIPRGHIVEEAI